MQGDGPGQATLLLERWRSGDSEARGSLIDLLEAELRAIARRLMRGERPGHTLQPTAVVGEACLRLLGTKESPASSRGEFLGLAAHVMRQVLVDHARQHQARKRGGDWVRVSLSHQWASEPGVDEVDALDLDAALSGLAELSPRQARVAELRYFGGLTITETAAALELGPTQVKREWAMARAWLKRRLRQDGAAPDPSRPRGD